MSTWCKHYDISLSGASHLLTYVTLITVKIQENENDNEEIIIFPTKVY